MYDTNVGCAMLLMTNVSLAGALRLLFQHCQPLSVSEYNKNPHTRTTSFKEAEK